MPRLWVCCLFLFMFTAHAKVYKCERDGQIVFTDRPDQCAQPAERLNLRPRDPFVLNIQADFNVSLFEGLQENLYTAFDHWIQFIDGGASVEVKLILADDLTSYMAARSRVSVPIYQSANTQYLLVGVAAEILQQRDPNGAQHDAEIYLNRQRLSAGQIWFDPEPSLRTQPVPAGKVDGLSLFIHELGHVFCYSGRFDLASINQGMPPNRLSTFDNFVRMKNNKPFFIGNLSKALFGSAVPLNTKKSVYSHFDVPLDSPNIPVMAEQSIRRQTRYSLTNLDVAVLHDCGLTLKPDFLKYLRAGPPPYELAKPK